jgi:diaminopimelate epimerase
VALPVRRDLVETCVEVTLPGGRLVIEWPEKDAGLLMKGPVSHLFRGIMNE